MMVNEEILIKNNHLINKVYSFDNISSTNCYSKNIIGEEKDHFMVIARKQFNAYGQYGRRYYSNVGGLYFSLGLKNIEIDSYLLVMIMAISIVENIKELYNIDINIKWVNDLYYQNKKLGGILIEKKDDDVVVGIGLNMIEHDFAKEIKDKAIALFNKEESYDIDYFLVNLLNKIKFYLLDNKEVYSKYINYSMLLHKNVSYNNKIAYVRDIREDGILVIEIDSKQYYLNSGKQSIEIL